MLGWMPSINCANAVVVVIMGDERWVMGVGAGCWVMGDG